MDAWCTCYSFCNLFCIGNWYPESPRWLITRKNDIDTSKKILSKLGIVNVDAEVASIIKSYQHETTAGHSVKLFSAKYNKILWLAFMVAFFNGRALILFYTMLLKFWNGQDWLRRNLCSTLLLSVEPISFSLLLVCI